jgi:hypothetical protein
MKSHRTIGAKARGERTFGLLENEAWRTWLCMRAIIVLKVKRLVINFTVFCLWDWKGKGANGCLGMSVDDEALDVFCVYVHMPVTNRIWRVITPDAHPHAKKQPKTNTRHHHC